MRKHYVSQCNVYVNERIINYVYHFPNCTQVYADSHCRIAAPPSSDRLRYCKQHGYERDWRYWLRLVSKDAAVNAAAVRELGKLSSRPRSRLAD